MGTDPNKIDRGERPGGSSPLRRSAFLRSGFGFAAWAASVGPAVAQAPREVTISRDSRYALALAPFKGSSAKPATELLRGDLEGVGIFNLSVEPGSGVFVATGTSRGGKIDGRLTAPDGAVVLSNVYDSGNLRQNVHRFADDIVRAVTGQPGIASGTIAFVSTQTGNKEIFLCDADGGNIRRVTQDQSIAVSPSISVDGSFLTYTGYQSGYADVYYIDLLTGVRHRIINAPGTNSGSAISPDGRRIALTMSYTGNTELYISGIGGGRGRRLTKSPGVEASPTWSPDGRELIYTSNASGSPQLYRMKTSGGRPRRIQTGFGHCTEPDWSPDGKRIAFNALSNGQKIVVLDLESGKGQIIGPGENPSWGADSRNLVYASGNKLIVHDVDSGGRRTIVSGRGKISEPSWTR